MTISANASMRQSTLSKSSARSRTERSSSARSRTERSSYARRCRASYHGKSVVCALSHGETVVRASTHGEIVVRASSPRVLPRRKRRLRVVVVVRDWSHGERLHGSAPVAPFPAVTCHPTPPHPTHAHFRFLLPPCLHASAFSSSDSHCCPLIPFLPPSPLPPKALKAVAARKGAAAGQQQGKQSSRPAAAVAAVAAAAAAVGAGGQARLDVAAGEVWLKVGALEQGRESGVHPLTHLLFSPFSLPYQQHPAWTTEESPPPLIPPSLSTSQQPQHHGALHGCGRYRLCSSWDEVGTAVNEDSCYGASAGEEEPRFRSCASVQCHTMPC
ncbi:unnamed protein product [Closterium sp. NIES-54]